MPTLTWIGKDKVVTHHHDVPFKVLNYQYTFNATCSPLSVEPANKIIHGDNLEALKALLPEYEGKIKCVYIDPPYNTGNEGWVYNDNVSDPRLKKWLGQIVGKGSEDLTRHDKWLCMMYPRLMLLHKLLAKDGAIFISIDDNEQANLKLICDEIFGIQNFVGQISILGNPRARDYGGVARMHDYLFVYQRSEDAEIKNIIDNDKKFPYEDSISGFETRELRNRNIAFHIENRPNLYYPFYIYPNQIDGNGFHKISLEPDEDTIILYPKESQGYKTVWRWGKPKSLENLNINIVGKKMSDGGYMVVEKYRKSDRMARSIWADKDVNTEKGTLLLKDIFGEKVFNFPKPFELVQRCLEMSTDEDSTILDCFAGSGTTAHAVLNLNKQDGGNRKFILIEMEDYAETITAERVKRVINGYAGKEGTNGSFDYYTLGEPLFTGENKEYLNEAVGINKIKSYIWYSETRSTWSVQSSASNDLLLGVHNQTAYYFIYHSAQLTSLDFETLAAINVKADQYIIYADNCLLPKDFLFNNNIIFKKIPRDISRF
jgi:adenine-specific DNA-methyltransferase